MEAAFEAVCDLCDIGHVEILSVFVVVFGEFEVDFLGEEEFEEEIHEFSVFFLFEVIVSEHHDAAADD